jgi:hypothetical protein
MLTVSPGCGSVALNDISTFKSKFFVSQSQEYAGKILNTL